ncbi:brain-specific angiogenesis inhibitor 1-associated protein 2 isoform X2 [Electrophorus electricus]|uniref:brain-specific angiogenesis inhibitor 1-associated protein 2 isoform X2 n=1 Tax=Electrophorus electricus TaxID=8005 RepID=UPI0015D04AD0|nr:brain-specific angiogenesis inhibitor 1-associated protein 2 isoform X2 [Electrophorus electricus]XP_035389654.1 brain-specific angiogenesis inhibitor 1-associated protein 2 isoform X2 [Electrophorus electricus]
MVLTEASKMSRADEVHRITENVYKSIMEQFNPCLRNFVAMGKTYEKALSSVTFAAKGYFDALVRMGELASESHGSKDLEEAAWDVLFQMAEVHRQIQMQLEDMLKSFHNELLTELEKKVELDARYLNAALKKYQMEHRSKGESLEKCQAELKKLRRKSQGSKNPTKYGDREMQYVEAISNKQSELDSHIAEGYKSALSEERRRYCFLVDRQCAVAKSSNSYHSKGKDLLTQKIPLWQQACVDPHKLPDRATLLAQQMGSVPGAPHHTFKSGLHISEPMPGAKPLPVSPELAALMSSQQRMMGAEGVPIVNGTVGEDYQHWVDGKAHGPSASSQVHRHGNEIYSNTLPVRKVAPIKSRSTLAETQTLPRSSSMVAGLERNGRTRVQAIFSHSAGDNNTLLSFSEGDVITLLVPEARDGWHYGENEKNRMRGWFPFSYTRVIPETDSNKLHVSLQHGRSCSTGNLLEREPITLPSPDYGSSARLMAHSASLGRPRPYSVAVPGFSQPGLDEYEARFPTSMGPDFARF